MEDIFSYIANELKNPIAAANLVEKFYKKIDDLRYFPSSCAKINNLAVKNNNLRKAIVENYIIFYNANENAKTIEIVRVLNGMTNYQEIL